MPGRVLVAGIGNIFFSDDGFGVEVARRLAGRDRPEGVTVADVGVRGLHLAYDILDGGYDRIVFVDAVPRGAEPGTLVVLEPDPSSSTAVEGTDPHGMTPDAVLRMVCRIGGAPPPVLVVGCEPATVEPGMGLSTAVEAAVEAACQLALDVATAEPGREAAHVPGNSGTARRALV